MPRPDSATLAPAGRGIEIKSWEYPLIAFSLLLFFTSFVLYVTEFPLRRYLFNIHDEVGAANKVGHVASRTGQVRRQLVGQGEFRAISQDNPLYDGDTIVTGTDGGARLMLDDGSSIDLGPDTMVRLTFETRLSLDGISRAANVDVVSGKVTGQAKKKRSLVLRTQEEVLPLERDNARTVDVESEKPREVLNRAQPLPATIPIEEATAPLAREKLEAAANPAANPVANPVAKPIVAPVATPEARPETTPAVPIAAAKPSAVPSTEPSEAPFIGLELISPRPNQRLYVKDGSLVPERTVAFEWKVGQPEAKLQFTLTRLTPKREDLLQKVVAARNGSGSIEYTLKSPGTYLWQLRDEKGEAIRSSVSGKSIFTLDPAFKAIRILDPLVGGEKVDSNIAHGKIRKNFEITLSWEAYPTAKDYKIWFGTSPSSKKALMTKTVSGLQYSFNKDRVYNGRVYYRVLAPLPSGFIAASPIEQFSFEFLPPVLVLPLNGARLSRAELAQSENGILFTWQKTNYTQSYKVEFSYQPDFRTIALTKSSVENYMVLRSPLFGKYYWRVRSVSGKIVSQPSVAYQFEVEKPLSSVNGKGEKPPVTRMNPRGMQPVQLDTN